MKFYAASRTEILSAMDIRQTVQYLKREEDIEGVRGEVGVYEPVLLTKTEIKKPVDTNITHDAKCDSHGIHVQHQQLPEKLRDEHELQH